MAVITTSILAVTTETEREEETLEDLMLCEALAASQTKSAVEDGGDNVLPCGLQHPFAGSLQSMWKYRALTVGEYLRNPEVNTVFKNMLSMYNLPESTLLLDFLSRCIAMASKASRRATLGVRRPGPIFERNGVRAQHESVIWKLERAFLGKYHLPELVHSILSRVRRERNHREICLVGTERERKH
jgi:hypothetical protein